MKALTMLIALLIVGFLLYQRMSPVPDQQVQNISASSVLIPLAPSAFNSVNSSVSR